MDENASILVRNQVIGDYGRGFSYNEQYDRLLRKLGDTAIFHNAQEYLLGNAEREGILARAARLDALNGPDLGVIPAIFLIYEGSTYRPNHPDEDFLISATELYTYIAGIDFLAAHVDPLLPEKLGRPFMIFLDHQLGYGSDRPVTKAVQSMLPLLKRYPNIHFFFDPEFRVTPEHKESITTGMNLSPGLPVGYVEAGDVNSAMLLIQAYLAEHNLALWRQRMGGTSEVILGIHQFQDLNIGKGTPWADKRTMIVEKEKIKEVPGITVVFDYDGVHPAHYGGIKAKYERYRQTMDARAYSGMMRWAFPGIKIFPPNPLWTADRYDERLFTLEELSGRQPIPDVGWFDPEQKNGTFVPRIIIIT